MKKIIGTTVAVILLGLLLYAAWTQRLLLVEGVQQLTLSQGLLVVLTVLPLGPLATVTWHQLLLGNGGKLTYREALAIWMLSNTARLLPGTVWQWIGRVYLAGTHGVSTVQATVSVAYEIAVLVVSALLVGFATLPFWPASLHLPSWLGLLAIPPLVFLWPGFLPSIVRLYARLRQQEIEDVPRLPWYRLFWAVLATVVQFFLMGGTVWALAQAFAPISTSAFVVLAGMQAAAWLLGYVTVIAPGGIGVADASRAGLLGSYVPLAVGSAIALTYRVLLLISEILVTLVAIALHPKVLANAKASTNIQSPSNK